MDSYCISCLEGRKAAIRSRGPEAKNRKQRWKRMDYAKEYRKVGNDN